MPAARFALRPRAALPALLVLAAALAAGCTEKLVQPPPPEPVFGVPDSVQQVFTDHCGFDGCHGGGAPQVGMDLSSARASWLAIVSVPAQQQQGQYLRIEPGDSHDSYVVMKLRNDARKGGQPMPLGGYPLDGALVIKIAAWAQAGAPGQDQMSAMRSTSTQFE
jgi:hypothetical protein